MDGRGALGLVVCLLITVAGCQQQMGSVPNSSTNSLGNNSSSIPANIKKVPAKPKDVPPLVLVSAADWKCLEAFAPGTEPDRQQQICEVARAGYEKALKKDPKCVAAYHGLGRLYSGLHDWSLAVETYKKALKLTPKDAALWYELGVCHNYQKNWAPALECLNRATTLEPGNRTYVNTQGVVLAAAGRYDESLKCFVRSNGEALGYYRMAQTLQHLQQTELSRRFLEVAVQKDPSLAPEIVKRPMIEDMANQTASPVQQTAYQAPSVPEVQVPSPSVPQMVSPPQPASAPRPAPQRVLLPSPPTMNEDCQPSNP